MALDYWFADQLRRYLLQFTRIFSGFQYQAGVDANGQPVFKTVPCRMALRDRLVSNVINNNSENTVNSAPMFTTTLTDVSISNERRQWEGYVEKVPIWEKKFDETTGAYIDEVGNTYTLERIMPVPYDLTMTLDLWTTNELQKYQLQEQIMILFNPALDLQHSENVFDWAALTIIYPQSIQWNSQSLPVGTDNELMISTWTFRCPIWISPPATLTRQKLIHQIITNIGDAFNMPYIGEGTEIEYDDQDLMARVITTPGNHSILVEGNEITLLGDGNQLLNPDGSPCVPVGTDSRDQPYSWHQLLREYGEVRPGISKLILKFNRNLDSKEGDVVGYIEYHPTESNKLLWSVDPMSLPANTLPNINAIIDPWVVYPAHGLPVSSLGQRYLVVNEIGDTTVGWDTFGVNAQANDIIEYDGTKWTKVWIAAGNTTRDLVLNSASGQQLRWSLEDGWVLAIDGIWQRGYWRVHI